MAQRIWVSLAIGLAFVPQARADLVVKAPTFTHLTSSSPTSGSFDITLSLTSPTTFSMDGYAIQLNFGAPTVGTITIDSVTNNANNALFGATGNFVGTPGVAFAQATDNNAALVTVTDGVGLFRVNYTLSANATGPISITFNALTLSGAPFLLPFVDLFFDNGQINTSAVPEPATLLLVTAATPIGAFVARRKKGVRNRF